MHVCLSICILSSVYLHVHLSICPSIYLSTCKKRIFLGAPETCWVFKTVCLSIYLSVYVNPSIYLYLQKEDLSRGARNLVSVIYHSVCQSIYQCKELVVYSKLSVYLFIYLSICMSFCLSINLQKEDLSRGVRNLLGVKKGRYSETGNYISI